MSDYLITMSIVLFFSETSRKRNAILQTAIQNQISTPRKHQAERLSPITLLNLIKHFQSVMSFLFSAKYNNSYKHNITVIWLLLIITKQNLWFMKYAIHNINNRTLMGNLVMPILTNSLSLPLWNVHLLFCFPCLNWKKYNLMQYFSI